MAKRLLEQEHCDEEKDILVDAEILLYIERALNDLVFNLENGFGLEKDEAYKMIAYCANDEWPPEMLS